MSGPSRIVYAGRQRSRHFFPKALIFFVSAAAVIVALGVGGWYLLNLPELRIRSISVLGAERIPADHIVDAVGAGMSRRGLLFFPADNFFIVSEDKIKRHLLENFPAIESADVDKRFPDGLDIKIKERALWGVYCVRGGIVAGQCFYIDAAGVAYEELENVAGSLLPRIYSSVSVGEGQVAVRPPLRQYYDDAAKALESIGLKFIFLELATSTQDAKLHLDGGWYLEVPLGDNSYRWLNVLRAVLDREIGQRRIELEYIDLRFGNKVFYKYRQ